MASRRPSSPVDAESGRSAGRHALDVVGRININVAVRPLAGRVPFSGRRSSAQGTMSVAEALRAFSVETVVAYSAKDGVAAEVARGLDGETAMLAPL